jgi:hypothetical protein
MQHTTSWITSTIGLSGFSAVSVSPLKLHASIVKLSLRTQFFDSYNFLAFEKDFPALSKQIPLVKTIPEQIHALGDENFRTQYFNNQRQVHKELTFKRPIAFQDRNYKDAVSILNYAENRVAQFPETFKAYHDEFPKFFPLSKVSKEEFIASRISEEGVTHLVSDLFSIMEKMKIDLVLEPSVPEGSKKKQVWVIGLHAEGKTTGINLTSPRHAIGSFLDEVIRFREIADVLEHLDESVEIVVRLRSHYGFSRDFLEEAAKQNLFQKDYLEVYKGSTDQVYSMNLIETLTRSALQKMRN